jgi:hypothetical protein
MTSRTYGKIHLFESKLGHTLGEFFTLQEMQMLGEDGDFELPRSGIGGSSHGSRSEEKVASVHNGLHLRAVYLFPGSQ